MPLDKLKFHNMCISHKIEIEKGRRLTVSKLIHKIRRLKYQLDKQMSNDGKSPMKLRKCLVSLDYLKKCKRLGLITQALVMEKPHTILTNGLKTPEEVAIAMFCTNKIMKQLLEKYRKELQLNDMDPSVWKPKLENFTKTKLKARRRRKVLLAKLARMGGAPKLKKATRIGKKTKSSRTSIKTKEKKTGNGETTQNVDFILSASNNWKVEEIDAQTAVTSVNQRKQLAAEAKVKVKQLAVITKNTESLIKSDDIVKSKISKLSSIPNLEKDGESTFTADPFFVTESGENYTSVAVPSAGEQPKNRDDEITESLIKSDYIVKPKKSKLSSIRNLKKEEQTTFIPDPFFVTESGENYMSVVVPSSGEQPKECDEMLAKKPKVDNEEFGNEKKKFDRRSRNERETSNNHTKNNETKVHPSWEAKRKMKSVISDFKGKKTVFNDDLAKDSASENTSKNHGNALHPSWAAKQKLKPTITAFQGKKIVFDNDE